MGLSLDNLYSGIVVKSGFPLYEILSAGYFLFLLGLLFHCPLPPVLFRSQLLIQIIVPLYSSLIYLWLLK